MKTTRRKFIQSTSLGFLGFFLPINSFGSPLVEKKLSNKDLAKRLKIAADSRNNGDLRRSKRIFSDIIEDYPNDIRAYDGLRKSLLQQKFNELEVLKIYEIGYDKNPNNKDFKERLAKEYMRLVLGNKKFTNKYNNSENLLKKSRTFFKQLKDEYPERKEYSELFEKVKIKIKHNADTLDARKNLDIKAHKKEQRKKFRNRFDKMNTQQLQDKLDLLLAKPMNPSRKKSVKEIYNLLIKRFKRDKDWEMVYILSLALYKFDNSDSKSLQKAKKFSLKLENYDILVSICEENHARQNTFWSKLGLFDSNVKRFEKTKKGDLSYLRSLLLELESEVRDSQQLVEVKARFIKLSFLNNDISSSKSHLISLGKLLSNTNNCHLSIRFNVLLSRFYAKKNDFAKAISIINIALGESNSIEASEDELLELAIQVNQEAKIEKDIHKKRLKQLLLKLQNKQTV